MNIYVVVEKGNESNCYVLVEQEHALIIDPNVFSEIEEIIDHQQITVDKILLTHEHVDHILGLEVIRERYRTKVYASQSCSDGITDDKKNISRYYSQWVYARQGEMPKEPVKPFCCREAEVRFSDQLSFEWNRHTVRMEHLPGHSDGSTLIFVDEEYLFSGDYFLKQKDGSFAKDARRLKAAYEKTAFPRLRKIPIGTHIYPGHGCDYRLSKTDREQFDQIFQRL